MVEDKVEEKPAEIRKPILEVYFKKDEKTGRPVVDWDIGANINAYFLVGLLEDIKQDVLDDIACQNCAFDNEEDNPDEY